MAFFLRRGKKRGEGGLGGGSWLLLLLDEEVKMKMGPLIFGTGCYVPM